MWKDEYKKKSFYWGLKPDLELENVLNYAKKGVALDIGAGEGRNSIFLAKNGFEVEAIDKVAEGLKKCSKLSAEKNLPIKTQKVNVTDFKFEENKYSLIISVASIDFLKLSEIEKIIVKIKKSLKEGGILYLFVFSIKDPAFVRCREKLEMTEENTFYLPKYKTFRHFFKKENLLGLLRPLEIIKIKEEETKDIHNNKPETHHIIKVIAKKKEV